MARTIAAALLLLLFAVVVAGTAVGIARHQMETLWTAPGPQARDEVVEIEAGLGLREIADRLGYFGVLRQPEIFALVVRLEGRAGDLRAGEFAVPAQASMAEVLEILTAAPPVQYAFTLAEGLTVRQTLERLRDNAVLSGDITLAPEEGTLLPETYHFTRGTERDALILRMQRLQAETLAELWSARAPDLPLDSPYEALILASVVERETGKAEERALVASVFINRLRKGARLQSDPTVIYALSEAWGVLDRELTREDLKFDNPYNTYKVAGLPPGPIAAPGRGALEAVLNPAETDFYYFVADGDGGHRFASDLGTHNQNVKAYRALRDKRAREREAAEREGEREGGG